MLTATPSVTTYTVSNGGNPISAGVRVKLSGEGLITPCAAADAEIGVTILLGGLSSYADATAAGVALNNHPGGRIVLLNGTCNAGDLLYRDANGQVATNGAGTLFGIASTAGVNGQWIEAIPYGATNVPVGSITTADIAPGAVTGPKTATGARKIYYVTGVDSTGGAANITVTGVAATDRIDTIEDFTTPAALTLANFTITGANTVSQAQAAGNLSAKKLRITTLPAAA